MSHRQQLTKPGRWVIKIGSAVLTRDGQGLDHAAMGNWAAEIAALIESGYEVVLVSSGSVAEGMIKLGWRERPAEMHLLQAAAAVGQMGLVQAWNSELNRFDRSTAQVLLTNDDLSDRTRYLNSRSTLNALLKLGVVPVINENDTVATDEIRFGDNDTLAALVANLVEADALIILTDQDGLFDSDPRMNASAKLIRQAAADDASLRNMAGGGGSLGRGGMITKLRAAGLASRSGTGTLICNGRDQTVITRASQGEELGTLLYARQERIAARKQWMAGQLQVRGALIVDDGASRVLQRGGKSLLPVGVIGVEGEFARGELVSCRDSSGIEMARGLVNYGSDESRQIMGCHSHQIVERLGYSSDEELIHRNNMVLV